MKKSGPKNKRDTVKFRQSSRKGYKKGFVPDLLGLDKKTVLNILTELKIKHHVNGVGIVSSQSIPAGEKIVSGRILNVKLEKPTYE